LPEATLVAIVWVLLPVAVLATALTVRSGRSVIACTLWLTGFDNMPTFL
jgi:hypothetical protein